MSVIVQKIDLFMRIHVLPHFNPAKIHWVFSLSGGKDSYVLCNAIREWYEDNKVHLSATGIHIWQWGEQNPATQLSTSYPWLDLTVIDAREKMHTIFDTPSLEQAPCRKCSNIRHYYSDLYLESLNRDEAIFLCRGLHMTDMAISILWRLVWFGGNTELNGKGKPLVHLMRNAYLAKPMCYVREFESQSYATQHNFTALHCDCPAFTYPSRRDIVEESVKQFYTSLLWEFDVPGIDSYLMDIAKLPSVAQLKRTSLPGMEEKVHTIPDAYFEFAKTFFLRCKLPNQFHFSQPLLEDYAIGILKNGCSSTLQAPTFSCKFLENTNSLSNFDLRMIGTLGPFWGAFALNPHEREYVWNLQSKIWGIEPDIKWSQVYRLMRLFYQSERNLEKDKLSDMSL